MSDKSLWDPRPAYIIIDRVIGNSNESAIDYGDIVGSSTIPWRKSPFLGLQYDLLGLLLEWIGSIATRVIPSGWSQTHSGSELFRQSTAECSHKAPTDLPI